MTEKYKIYVPEDIRTRLINDAELFEFQKKDGTVNLNAFLKELLVNYFDQYRIKKEQLWNDLLDDLESQGSISKRDAEALAERIINVYMKNDDYRADRNCAITLTVSGRSLDVMRSIENNLLSEKSMSQYVCDLFISYLSIARNSREVIIFRDKFEALGEAIRKRNVVTFTSTTAPNLTFQIKPYLIAASKEEQCNYLLCTDVRQGFYRSFRVSRIQALYTTSQCFDEDREEREKIQEIARRSPQSASKAVEARVFLTEQGIQKFRVIVKNRPDVLRKEGNTYYFQWPGRQLEDYFSRFGQDAIILSPKDCRDSMRSFYKKALEAYSDQPVRNSRKNRSDHERA